MAKPHTSLYISQVQCRQQVIFGTRLLFIIIQAIYKMMLSSYIETSQNRVHSMFHCSKIKGYNYLYCLLHAQQVKLFFLTNALAWLVQLQTDGEHSDQKPMPNLYMIRVYYMLVYNSGNSTKWLLRTRDFRDITTADSTGENGRDLFIHFCFYIFNGYFFLERWLKMYQKHFS